MADTNPAPISEDELKRLFPLTRPAIAEKTYEIGLTLGGTVSAGTYTAGVLDYLMEALDAWTRGKEDNSSDAPLHKVVIGAIAGASGGAINGAIFTRLAGWHFPHGAVAGNPYYDLWVNGVDLMKLLEPVEPGISSFVSILNTSSFADLANGIITWKGAPLGTAPMSPRQRSYLADPLRLSMMVANVTGIPYRISFRGESGLDHELVAHADYMKFGLTVPGGVPNPPGIRPDEAGLVHESATSWDILAAAALATCAFPAAFRSRPISRALETLGYRAVAVPGEKPEDVEIAQLIPIWDAMSEDGSTPGMFRTVNVDGGTHNNEPLDHTRIALAGLTGRNKRNGAEADRGVVLIDPFSDPVALSLFDPPAFFGLIGPLINALVQQSRFKPEDIALASDYDTFSRFLVAPIGPGPDGNKRSGGSAIASGGLGGFLGFVDKRFLDYDFRLGRRNAYAFLRNEFVLPEANPLFRDTWTTDQIRVHGFAETNPQTGNETRFLPIIPLMPNLRNNPPEALNAQNWPRLSAFPTELNSQVRARLDAIYDGLKKEKWWPGGVGGFAANTAWKTFLRGTLCDAFVGKIEQGLKQQKLL